MKNVLEQQRIRNLTQMFQRRLHIHYNFQDLRIVACLFQEMYRQLANLRVGVVQLRKKQAKRPGIGDWARLNEVAEMVSCVQTDVLYDFNNALTDDAQSQCIPCSWM